MKNVLADKRNSSVIRSRAEFARNVEYLRCMAEDAYISNRMNVLDELSEGYMESEEEDVIDRIDERISVNGDEDAEQEVNKILDSDKDISIDEIMNIQTMTDQDITESVDFLCIMNEGVNLDTMDVKRTFLKDIKKELKLAKKAYKQGNFDEAIKHMSTASKLYDRAGDNLAKIKKNMKGSITPIVIGFFIRSWVTFIKTVGFSLLTLPLFGVGGVIYSYAATINDIIGTVNACITSAKKEGKVGVEDFNFYYNSIKTSYDRLGTAMDKTLEAIKEAKKEQKVEKVK